MSNKARNNEVVISNTSRKDVNIFGVQLVSTKKQEVLNQVRANIERNDKFLLFTPNPEILLKARKNKKLQDVINKAEIKVSDGVGIRLAYNYLCKNKTSKANLLNYVKEPLSLFAELLKVPTTAFSDKRAEDFPIIKGREFFVDLVEMSLHNDWKIFFLGGTDGVSLEVEKKLKKKFKNIKVKNSDGPMLDNNARPLTKVDENIERKVIDEINRFKPDILFVAFGAPKQELWSSRNLSKLNTKAVMVVGGTFDYISGKVKMPPKWIGDNGLEWFWRLIIQPSRIGRIFRATIVFPLYLLKQKTISVNKS